MQSSTPRNKSTENLKRLYEAGYSYDQVAEQVGLSGGPVVRGRLQRSGYQGRTPSEGHRLRQAQKRPSQLTGAELADCRIDPAYEARHKVADYVICRDCGVSSKMPLTVPTGHFAVHHPSLLKDEYRERFPEAPFHSCAYSAKYTRMRDGRKVDLQTFMAQRANEYASASDLRECLANVNWEKDRGITDFIVCRKCARKIKDRNLTGHARLHGYKRIGYYLADYPDAPTVIPKHAKKQRIAHADRRTKERDAEQAVRAARADVARIANELAQAKMELAKAKEVRAESRRKVHPPQVITEAIQRVRQMPYVANRTAIQALNISEAGLYRWLEEGKLKRYKKGYVYSIQIVQILDRPAAKG